MWPGVFLFQSDSRILLSTKSIKKSIDINWYRNNHQEKRAPSIINFCQRWPVKILVKLDWRFHQDHRVLWKRSVGNFVFCMDLVIKGSLDDFAALLQGADLFQYLASVYFFFHIILGLIQKNRSVKWIQLVCFTREICYTPSWEIASLKTRFSGKWLETSHPLKIYLKKLFHYWSQPLYFHSL